MSDTSRKSTHKYFATQTAFDAHFEKPHRAKAHNGFTGAGFYDLSDGWALGPNAIPDRICAPMVVRDMPEHWAPDDRAKGGRQRVTSRSQFREVCKKYDVVPYDRGLKGDTSEYMHEKVAIADNTTFNPEYRVKMFDDHHKRLEAAGFDSDMKPRDIIITP